MSETNLKGGRPFKSKFTNVGSVLNDVVRELGLDRRMREQTLRQIWPTIVGEPFQDKTRVLFIDSDGNLVVSVRDGSTAQDLTFAKRQVLTKIRPAAKALGLNLNGLRLDLKHYCNKIEPVPERSINSHSPATIESKAPDEAELNQIELSDREKEEIRQLYVALRSAEPPASAPVTSEQTENRLERIVKIYERQLRLVNWRRSKGFPGCSRCSYPTSKLHTREQLCSECYIQDKATTA